MSAGGRARRRSLVGRAAWTVAGFALVAVALLWAVTAWVVRHESDAMLARAVDTEIAALADIYATGGERELVARLGDRLTLHPDGSDAAHYLLADASGRRIAGDIAHWPLLSAENSQAGFVTLADGSRVFARATQLDGRLRVVAAREYGGRTALLRRIAIAFAVAGLAILLAAFALAWRVAARLQARVRGMNDALDAIELGNLDARVPGDGEHDELGELAAHANQLAERMGAAIRSQRDITDQVAHEMRTPLVHLDTHLLKLIDRAVDPALVQSLGAVRTESRRIGDLLDSLLDIAASEARRGDRSGFAHVDLSQIGRDLADLYADSATEMGLELRAEIAPEVTLSGDAMQLTRAITNLLDNAFKYAGRGSRVVLAIEQGPRIVVRDNGPGIPADQRERVFERFQRCHRDRGGHGLGLALVRAIARRHDLEVYCTDAEPGAQFTIEREREA